MSCHNQRHTRKEWTPPSEPVRRAALGKFRRPKMLVAATQSCCPASSSCQCSGACFRTKTAPTKGNWLADGMPGESERGGQTFADFARGTGRLPSHKQRTIRLVNIDEEYNNDPSQKEVMELLCKFVSIYYNMPCELMEPLTEQEQRKMRINMDVLPQIQSESILSILYHRLRKREDTFAVLGVTLLDLFPGPEWDFILGEACAEKGVGIFSFARYTQWFKAARNARLTGTSLEEIDPLCWKELLHDKQAFRGALITLGHEMGHLIQMEHCIYYQCVMNGYDEGPGVHLPIHLCPVCLRKWFHVVGKTCNNTVSILGRYEKLADFLSECGLEEDSLWYREAIVRCSNYHSRRTSDSSV